VLNVIQTARSKAAFAREHLQALHIGSEVTGWFRREREPHVLDVTPENVIAALNKAGVSFVLMGTHGINGYRSEARATQDVDVLVVKKDIRKAVRTLERVFPYLETVENSAVVRFVDPVTQKSVVDVIKPSSEAIREVFRHAVPVGKSHRIPDLEAAVFSKYLALTGPNRKPAKKLLDAADFTDIVVHNRAVIDLDKLLRLGNKVQPHGGTKILKLVEEIDAGRTIRID
jgi:hypothetical protein